MKSLFLNRLHSDDQPMLVFDGAMNTNMQVQIYDLKINSLLIYQ